MFSRHNSTFTEREIDAFNAIVRDAIENGPEPVSCAIEVEKSVSDAITNLYQDGDDEATMRQRLFRGGWNV